MITTTFDTILSNSGWDEGWRILRAMCANTRYFTNQSTKPPIDVGQGEVYGTLAWSWEDDFRGDWPDESIIYQRIKAINNTDVMVGYRTDNWNLRAYVENVFDGVWYDGNYSNDDPDQTIIFAEHAFGPARPRTAGVRFTYNF